MKQYGDGTFQSSTNITSDSDDSRGIAVADVDGDTNLDVIVSNYYYQSNKVYLGNGDGTFQNAISFGPSADASSSLAVIDVDGDGNSDVVIVNDNQANKIYFGDGTGIFTSAGVNITNDTDNSFDIVVVLPE